MATLTEVIDGAAAPYARVHAIHDFLTDNANGFIYSLSTAPGTSGNDLVDFLRLRRGYCEQYAGAMAVMVRAAGVPARMALGYTPGTRLPDGTRMITSNDAHAWVEVYFRDLGWVPFDPTPISRPRAGRAALGPPRGTPTPTASGPDVAAPTSAAAARPTAIRRPRRRRRCHGRGWPADARRDVASAADRGGVLVLVMAVPGAPGGAARAAAPSPAGRRRCGRARDELTATATDLGLRVHPAWTPRRAAAELGGRRWTRRGRQRGQGRRPAAGAGRGGGELRSARTHRRGAGPGRCAPDGAAGTARRDAAPGRLRARLWPASLVAGVGQRVAARVGRWTAVPRRPRKTGRTRTV